MHSIIKSSFYIIFIIVSLVAGISMLTNSKGDKRVKIFGFMVLFLGLGEGFHIVPRIIEIFNENHENIQSYINTGRFIASLSIILVYFLLNWFWKLYYRVSNTKNIHIALLILGFISLIVSMILRDTDNLLLVFVRNVPIILIASIVVYNFKKSSSNVSKEPLRFLWLAVLLGLVFTVGFELLSPNYSLFIILMMPKTLVYIWLILMGYISFKKNLFEKQI